MMNQEYDSIRERVNDEILGGEINFDEWLLLKALEQLGNAFNDFISCTLNDEQQPKAPSMTDIAKARAYLPPHCSLAYKKKQEVAK